MPPQPAVGPHVSRWRLKRELDLHHELHTHLAAEQNERGLFARTSPWQLATPSAAKTRSAAARSPRSIWPEKTIRQCVVSLVIAARPNYPCGRLSQWNRRRLRSPCHHNTSFVGVALSAQSVVAAPPPQGIHRGHRIQDSFMRFLFSLRQPGCLSSMPTATHKP
jgi:hypothetical protein